LTAVFGDGEHDGQADIFLRFQFFDLRFHTFDLWSGIYFELGIDPKIMKLVK
jgi:hypothetical protein